MKELYAAPEFALVRVEGIFTHKSGEPEECCDTACMGLLTSNGEAGMYED